MQNLKILVMSCDKYEDCWAPYLECLHKFWEDCPYAAVLCTEHLESNLFSKTILCDGMWSKRVLTACDQLESEFVLFTLDDFWLSRPVNTKRFDACMKLMCEIEDVGVVYLDAQSSKTYSDYYGFQDIPFGTPYRVSAGPAIWRVSFLKSILKEEESAWDFERIGSFREEGSRKHAVQTEDRIWARVCTMGAIERGRWERSLTDFVQQNHISADLSGRQVKSKADDWQKAVKNVIYNMNPSLILKVQNWLYIRKKKVHNGHNFWFSV